MRLVLQDDDGTAWIVADDIEEKLSPEECTEACAGNLNCGHEIAWDMEDIAKEVCRGIDCLKGE